MIIIWKRKKYNKTYFENPAFDFTAYKTGLKNLKKTRYIM